MNGTISSAIPSIFSSADCFSYFSFSLRSVFVSHVRADHIVLHAVAVAIATATIGNDVICHITMIWWSRLISVLVWARIQFA